MAKRDFAGLDLEATLDEVGDLGALELRTRINGEVLQQGTTANLIFGPADLIAWLSRTLT